MSIPFWQINKNKHLYLKKRKKKKLLLVLCCVFVWMVLLLLSFFFFFAPLSSLLQEICCFLPDYYYKKCLFNELSWFNKGNLLALFIDTLMEPHLQHGDSYTGWGCVSTPTEQFWLVAERLTHTDPTCQVTAFIGVCYFFVSGIGSCQKTFRACLSAWIKMFVCSQSNKQSKLMLIKNILSAYRVSQSINRTSCKHWTVDVGNF